MILQSLTRYYELLAEDGKLPKPGYCTAKVSYALNLSEDGELLGVVHLIKKVQRGKKEVEVPQGKEVPEQMVRSSGISPFFLCDTSSYFLGIDGKGKPERSKDCFAASGKLHETVLNGVNSPAAKAVLGFFRNWQPEQAAEHPALKEKLEEIKTGGNLIFMLNGGPFAQDDPALRHAWEDYRDAQDPGTQMVCLVTGKEEPVAVLHGKIKGVTGAQTAGANLVSFNASAYESYGREKAQGLNAPIGQHAAFAYATALNHLLSDREHRISLGDTTVVYWAESPKPVYQDIFTAMLSPQSENQNRLLDNIMKRVEQGKLMADDIEIGTPFYILGLAPNAARLSVRFFLRDSFGNFITHIKQHYEDLDIAHAPQDFPYLTLYWLLQETVNPNSSNKASSPLLSGEVMRSILLGRSCPYPRSLQSAVMLRIRAEQDDEDRHIKKITRGRAAILKACLLRNRDKENYEEVLDVSLNEESNNRAYVLGRMFAVLEKAQRDANPGINSTIKDRYFTSACATPGSVFSTLFKLYENHIEKIRKMENGKGIGIYDDKLVSGLMNKLNIDGDPFPAHLLLNDQSIFVLGYYHQTQSFFTPKDKKQNTEEE
ncbi:MAG TPA: type I-C CRISPR-associated protein Cas8c/Csd1 [Caproiciproducens sp.]|nr:type I-C CRISPR-associated protein Cas8c/Csd1 [Caproiciproducens sp.]